MTFEDALRIAMDVEGGFSDDPKDAGGLTKWGISSMSYPEVNDPSFNVKRAIEIYRVDFWLHFKCDELPNGVKLVFFDGCINQTQQAPRLLQKSVKVLQDGVIGPLTVAAVKQADQPGLINELGARRALAYAIRHDVEYYGLGWYRRLMKIEALAHDDWRVK